MPKINRSLRQPEVRYRSSNPYKRAPRITLVETLVVIIILGILAAIAIPVFLSAKHKDAPENSDPRVGWVHVEGTLKKKCDGTTMLYQDTWDDEFHVAANAPECSVG